jgi:hypothetical protein
LGDFGALVASEVLFGFGLSVVLRILPALEMLEPFGVVLVFFGEVVVFLGEVVAFLGVSSGI